MHSPTPSFIEEQLFVAACGNLHFLEQSCSYNFHPVSKIRTLIEDGYLSVVRYAFGDATTRVLLGFRVLILAGSLSGNGQVSCWHAFSNARDYLGRILLHPSSTHGKQCGGCTR